MRDSILPPYVWLVFIVIAILAGLVGVIIDHREMLAARLEIVQSHRAMASIVAYRVERADYTAQGAPATVRVKRDRYLLTLEFTDMNGVLQQAHLQWFNVYEMGGLPVRRHPPWVGELEELERQPRVRIYQHNSSPVRVRLAHPLDELAGGSEIDPSSEKFDLRMLVTFSLLVALVLTITYGALYFFWRAIHVDSNHIRTISNKR